MRQTCRLLNTWTAFSYSAEFVVPSFSCFSSVACTSGGKASRSRFASLTHNSIEGGESAMVRERRPFGRRMPCSAPSMPPQDWPTT